jgi:lactoylglutathione lyase
MRLHHTNLRVIDPVPSVEFYRALGLELVGCMNLGATYTLYLGIPGDGFLVELTVNPDGTPDWAGSAGTGHLALAVEDLPATVAGLAERGIAPVIAPFHPGDRGDVYVCFLEDPSGYRVELIHGELIPARDPLPASLSFR